MVGPINKNTDKIEPIPPIGSTSGVDANSKNPTSSGGKKSWADALPGDTAITPVADPTRYSLMDITATVAKELLKEPLMIKDYTSSDGVLFELQQAIIRRSEGKSVAEKDNEILEATQKNLDALVTNDTARASIVMASHNIDPDMRKALMSSGNPPDLVENIQSFHATVRRLQRNQTLNRGV